MIDAAVFWGNEAQVTERIEEMMSIGSAELLASPVVAGADRAASLDRTLRLLGQVAKSRT